MSTTKTIITTVTQRAWHDLEPKLIAFATTGLSAAVITEGANYVGVHISPALAVAVSTVIATIAGYLKSSTAKTLIPAGAPAVASFSLPVVTETPAEPVIAEPVIDLRHLSLERDRIRDPGRPHG